MSLCSRRVAASCRVQVCGDLGKRPAVASANGRTLYQQIPTGNRRHGGMGSSLMDLPRRGPSCTKRETAPMAHGVCRRHRWFSVARQRRAIEAHEELGASEGDEPEDTGELAGGREGED